MINLYFCEISQFKTCYAMALKLLTPQRRLKTQRFSGEADKLRSLAAGLLMRTVLGVKRDEQLVYNQYGKPALKKGLEFNLSHAGDLVILATGTSPLGVDTEFIREPKWKAAQKAFQQQELEWLKKSCFPEQDFYWLWTRKESLLKACGQGLYLKPSSFSVLPSEQEFFIIDQCFYGLSSFVYGKYIVSLAVQEQKPRYQKQVLTLIDFNLD